MSFTIFKNEKTPFWAIKTRSWKCRKIDIFPKGLTNGFGPKLGMFPTFFFRQYRPEKCLLQYFRTKKRLSRLYKHEIQKVENLTFFQRDSWFWSKTGHFSNLFFVGNIGQENPFYDIVERKNAFLGYKNKKFKKSKNWHFPKGLTHCFGPKMAIFPSLFLGNIGYENAFYDILEGKNAFLGYKNKKLKKSENWHFSKGTHCFGPKLAIFPTFFFRQYGPGKCLLRYCRTKKRLSKL